VRTVRPLSLAVASFFGLAAVVSAAVPTPEVILVAIGVPMAFFVPGLALVCVAVPDWRWSEERLAASVGLSVAIATCVTVLLAATGIGLTRPSLAVSLGGITILLSMYGFTRSKTTHPPEPEVPVEF
jgi:uncharacterized membrane protein